MFGNVVEGQDVVDAVEQGDRIERVEILRIGTDVEEFSATSEKFTERVASSQQDKMKKQESERASTSSRKSRIAGLMRSRLQAACVMSSSSRENT